MIRGLLINDVYKTDLPTSWDEVSMKQYYQIELLRKNKGDLVEALPIITDIPLAIWNKCNLANYKSHVLPNIQWIKKDVLWRKIKMATELKFEDKVIEIPLNLEFETLGQKVAVDQKMEYYSLHFKDDLIRMGFYQMTYIIAAYISPKISEEKFSVNYTDEIQLKVMSLPAVEIIPIGNFFLSSLKDSIKSSNRYQVRKEIKQRLMQISRTSKNLVFSGLGMHSHRVI